MGFFFSCYGCSYSGHFQIIHWHSCSAGQEQMFSAYPPLFLKQEDAYFGSCGGCYMQGKKVFMADFSFPHLHRDSCFSPSPGQRWELWTAFRKCLCTNTHTHIWFHVSVWEQWPALFIVPICSSHLKQRLKKTFRSQSLQVRPVRHNCINVNLENKHRLVFLLWIQARNPCSDRTGEQKWCQTHTVFD